MVDESFIAAEAPPGDAVTIPEEQALSESPLPPAAEFQQMFAELKQSLAEFKQSRPELEVVRKELRETALQRDNHAAELKKLKVAQTLQSIADDYSFNDVEYLEFVLQKNNVQCDNPEAVKSFMLELKKSKPRFFNLQLKSGAGSRPGQAVGNVQIGSGVKRMDALEMLISHAREIN